MRTPNAGRKGHVLIFLGLALLCLAPVVLSARPLLLNWGNSPWTLNDITSSNQARRLANLSFVPASGVVQDETNSPTLHLVDDKGYYRYPTFVEIFNGPAWEYYTPSMLLEVTKPNASMIFNSPFLTDPIVTIGGESRMLALTQSGNIYTWGPNELTPPLWADSTTVENAAPATDSMFTFLTEGNLPVGLIGASGQAYVYTTNEIICEGSSYASPQQVQPIGLPPGTVVYNLAVRSFLGLAVSTHPSTPTSTDVWTWGRGNRLGTATNDSVCYPTPTRILAGENITHLAIGPAISYLVYQSKNVFTFGLGIPEIDNALTSLVTDRNLVQIASSSTATHFLFDDGTMWTRIEIDARSFLPGIPLGATSASLAAFADSAPLDSLWQANFEPALPAGNHDFKITKLFTTLATSAMYAVATPTTASAVELPLILPPSTTSTPISSTKVIMWGSCPSAPKYPAFGSNYVTYPTELELRHLPSGYHQIIKVAASGETGLILTAAGLLAYGTYDSNGGGDTGKSPYHVFADWRVPQIVNASVYDGAPIVDIAVTTDTSMILLQNGSIIGWGPGIVSATEISKRKASFGIDEDSHYLSERDTTQSMLYTSPDPNHYSYVLRTDSIYTSLKSTGRVFGLLTSATRTLVTVNLGIVAMVTHAYGALALAPVNIYSISQSSFLALTVDSGSPAMLVVGETRGMNMASNYDCIGPIVEHPIWSTNYLYCTLNTTKSFVGVGVMDLGTITQMTAGVTDHLILNAQGVWILGQAGYSTTFAGHPSPVFFNGLYRPESAITRISTGQTSMYAHYADGTIRATCGDLLTGCLDPLNMVQILQDYKVLPYSPDNVTYSGSECIMAAIDTSPGPGDFIPTEPHFRTIFFGENACGIAGFGDASYRGYTMSGRILPLGHPLESPTVTDVTVGCGLVMRDGNFSGGGARWLRWGTFEGQVANRAAWPSYLITIGSPVKWAMPKVGYLALSDICTLAQLEIGMSNSIPVVDTEYAPTWVNRYQIPMNTPAPDIILSQCQAQGVPPVDMKCASAGPQMKGLTWCLIRTLNGSLFSYGFDDGFSLIDCKTGQFGYISTCLASVMANTDYQGEIDVASGPSALTGETIASYDVGLYHALVLTVSGKVISWGSYMKGQAGLGIDPTPVLTGADIPSRVDMAPIFSLLGSHSDVTKIVTSNYNSYAVVDDMYIAAWGDNANGQLGLGASGSALAYSTQPVLVHLPPRPIMDFKCSFYSCFTLFTNGAVYSWGYGATKILARDIGEARFDATPALANQIAFPGAAYRRVTNIITSKSSYGVFFRAIIDPSGSPPVEPPCVGSPPSPDFTCIRGVWTYLGSLTIGTPGGPTQVVISGPTVIIGNVTVAPGSSITIVNPLSGNAPLVNVTGCFSSNGTMEIQYNPKQWSTTKGNLDGHKFTLVESSCDMSQITAVTVTKPKDCRKASSKLSTDATDNGRQSLLATMKVDSSKCSVWWIVLVSVFGVVVIGVIIGAVLWTVHRRNMMSKVGMS